MTRKLSAPEIEFNEIMRDGDPVSALAFEAVQRFSLSFSLLEAKLLGCDSSQGDSGEYATNFINQDLVNFELLSAVYVYNHFKNRYATSEDGYRKYQSLCRDRGGKLESPVFAILRSDFPDTNEMLKSCLYIAFRLRNNLFHGPKWLNDIEKQACNLNAVSHLLQDILHRSRDGGIWNEYE
ncbi:hypothetical protein [Serratia ficaria]|uniref:hypothetical protein n=1 Tax=Serratia ficaria TaxID=61651 RepID=UPI0021777A08|nr:hypothetical protein [Serratia ficaria]CAI1566111.1 Uncharacterised protein [Serratia ficaria]